MRAPSRQVKGESNLAVDGWKPQRYAAGGGAILAQTMSSQEHEALEHLGMAFMIEGTKMMATG